MRESPADAPSSPTIPRIAPILILPLLAGVLVWVALAWTDNTPESDEEAASRRAAIQSWWSAELNSARTVAEQALDDFEFATRGPRSRPGLISRLEGLGLVDRDLVFLTWSGRPPEPDPGTRLGAGSPWSLRRDGVNTRLVIQTAPDASGRRAVAGFLVDSEHDALGFGALVPADLRDGVAVIASFDARRPAEAMAGVGAALDAPDGTELGWFRLDRVAPSSDSLRRMRLAGSMTLLLFGLLCVWRFDWRRIVTRPGGLLIALGLIAGLRALLLVLRAPHPWFPSSWSSAGLYGSAAGGGLIGSPLDLLLTGFAFYLGALALRRAALALRRRSRLAAVALAGGATLGMALTAAALVFSLARNSTVPLLESQGFWRPDARLALGLGLAVVLIGTAECLVACYEALAGRTNSVTPRPGRLAVVVTFLVLALAGALALQELQQRLDLERLESEFVPQVLEQSSRRSVALNAAVRQVHETLGESPSGLAAAGWRAEYPAYRYWSSSELFLSGYKSSIELYDVDGNPVSQFGFDLPPRLEQPVADPELPELIWTAEEEEATTSTARERLLHAEMVLQSADGTPLGTVIGHVIDEPDNLPFLPGPRTFLQALGPGPGADRLFGGPHYVLYDAQGTVVLSTLREPPSESTVRSAGAAGAGPIRIDRGGEAYRGVAIRDDGRLHLLLTETRTAVERLAAAVRLAIVGLLWLALHTLAISLRRPGAGHPFRLVRQSLQRRLLVGVLLASAVPLILLALFLRGYIQAGGEAALEDAATQLASAAQRVLTDYAAVEVEPDAEPEQLDDPIVSWLSDVIGQEIHVYERGLLRASSKRELFTSGLLPERLDGDVYRRMAREGLPYLVVEQSLGPQTIPVAYAPVRDPDVSRELVVAVPMVGQRTRIAREVNRVIEMILLATVLLVGLLWFVAVQLARTVASPLRELVGATGRIAAGDYETRLEPRTSDEVAELVRGFNGMASALATQRADLERRRDYMERLLQHATTGVISVDGDDRVVTLNPAARSLLGAFGGRPVPGDRLTETLGETPTLTPLAGALGEPERPPGEPRDIDLELERQPRRIRLVQVELPQLGSGPVGKLLLLDDVTELMRSNQLAAWAEMARAIAHEIKNPLTPIQLSTEHLRRLLNDRGLLPSKEMEACLDTVIKQVRTLYDIAGEFSAYAKLPALSLEPTDPVQFLREVVAPYRAAPPPGIELVEEYEKAETVLLDSRVLGRAVVNLIENALQAMPDGGVLRLSVVDETEEHNVRLSVADSGIGLEDEVRRRLFEPYFSTKSSGTGLGLAIVQRSVLAHRGTIDVEERQGGGTVFHIRLPRARPIGTE